MDSYLHELTRRLVAWNTVSSNTNAPVMEYLGEQLEGHGFRVLLQRTEVAGTQKVNLVACAGPPEPDGLIISGHVDTVPFEDQPGWTRDPLRLAIEDDRVYGRGTSDMKAFIAQCVDAAARLELNALTRPLVFVFTADEEVGMLGAERLLPDLPDALRNLPQPRLAWIGEPTSDQVFHTHKGVGLVTITVHGIGGHSSVPEKGANAIAVAGRIIETLGHYQAELRGQPSAEFASLFPEAPYTSLNFGVIRGGSAGNMIAEECTLLLSYRPLPRTDPAAIHAEIVRRVRAVEPRDYGSELRPTIEVGEPFIAPPLFSPRHTPLERVLFAEFDTTISGGAPFGTDGCQLARAGIDSLICGPGELDQAHQPDESIRREAFERGSKHILSVIHKMCMAQQPA